MSRSVYGSAYIRDPCDESIDNYSKEISTKTLFLRGNKQKNSQRNFMTVSAKYFLYFLGANFNSFLIFYSLKKERKFVAKRRVGRK